MNWTPFFLGKSREKFFTHESSNSSFILSSRPASVAKLMVIQGKLKSRIEFV